MHFEPIGRATPRTLLSVGLRPRLWSRTWRHAPAAIRFIDAEPGDTPGHRQIVRWTYDPERHGRRLCLTFRDRHVFERDHFRWRVISDLIWGVVEKTPGLIFRDIAVDISDGADSSLPPDVLRFVRRPGDPHELLPNLHLLAPRLRLPAPRAWDRKSDTIYFRGAATGAPDYSRNVRVAACLAANALPGGDCLLTAFHQVDDAFQRRARQEGIRGTRDSRKALNRHRYLIDVDGNTSSWDRFWLIGWFGGVPIRFEPVWEEFWTAGAHEEEHYVTATRESLAAVMAELRGDPARARRIAQNAAAFVRRVLAPEPVRQTFETIWRRRAAAC